MPRKRTVPSDLADKFMLRLPDGLRTKISLAAKHGKRSMNSEIVDVLERAFPDSTDELTVRVPEGVIARLKDRAAASGVSVDEEFLRIMCDHA